MFIPDDINLLITEYLDNDTDSITYLRLCGISLKKYISKEYHDLNVINNEMIIRKIYNCLTLKNITFPSNITHLSFSYLFNEPVDNLPQTITHLYFSMMFNQQVN